MINKIVVTLYVLCIAFAAKAHQPDLSSTILAEKDENKWVLQIRAALTAFEYEVVHSFGEDAYATPEEFQELVMNLVRENMSIVINGAKANELQNGHVKLGHETTITFEVPDVPDVIESLVVRNSSFSDISRNQSGLIVLKKGFAKDQFILNSSNKHTVELKATDSKFVLVAPTQKKTPYYFLILAGLVFAMSVLYFIFKNRRRVMVTPAFINS